MSERDIWRCDVTGNPVGADTRMIGAPPCSCQGCRASARVAELEGALLRISRMRGEDLYYGPDEHGVDNAAAAVARAVLNAPANARDEFKAGDVGAAKLIHQGRAQPLSELPENSKEKLKPESLQEFLGYGLDPLGAPTGITPRRPAQSPAGAVWQPMETEPYDGKFRLYGLHCSSRNGHNWFEVHYVALDGELITPSGDSFTDWSHDDFEVWMDVPAPPPDSGAPR